jgi:hypothetical protein
VAEAAKQTKAVIDGGADWVKIFASTAFSHRRMSLNSRKVIGSGELLSVSVLIERATVAGAGGNVGIATAISNGAVEKGGKPVFGFPPFPIRPVISTALRDRCFASRCIRRSAWRYRSAVFVSPPAS